MIGAMEHNRERDEKYLSLLISRISVCLAYKPKFGQGHAVSLTEFKTLYGSDSFYAWFGLDDPLLYAAHKAAGGITSLYRQIGTGCEQLFRQIIRDQFELTDEQARWSYTVTSPNRKDRTLSLDARIQIANIQSEANKQRMQQWMTEATTHMGVDSTIASALKGAVFEVRQGYKSKDSKRQNADISNAGTAYAQGYLPVVVILSGQIDGDVADRYTNAGWLLWRGSVSDSPLSSTFAFCAQVLGYDLAGFFEMYSATIKVTVQEVLKALLTPSDMSASYIEGAVGLDLPDELASIEDDDLEI